mgnify:CR=1 FL=1
MPKRLSVVEVDLCVGCQSCMFVCSRRFGVAGTSKSAIKIHSVAGFESGFTVEVCRACKDPPCAAVCPTGALESRDGFGVKFDSKKCIGCKNCQKACVLNAVFWDYDTNKPIICIYCGVCAKFCPYNVLKLEEVE